MSVAKKTIVLARATGRLGRRIAASLIPSDYCIDYAKLTPGNNRNLDVRREFQRRLDQVPIAATSILSGMFTNLLTGQALVVLSSGSESSIGETPIS